MNWFGKKEKREVPTYEEVATRATTTHDVSKDEAIIMLITEVGQLRQSVQTLQTEVLDLKERLRKIGS